MSNRNDLPPPSAANFDQRLRETIQTYLGRQGDPLDRGLTLRDLVENGIVKFKNGFGASSASGGGAVPIAPVVVEDAPDLTPPPQPSGFTVSAAISHVFIEHGAPTYTQGHGHLRTRVYGAIVKVGDPLPTFDKAVEVGQFSGQVWAMPSNPGTTWRLWTKWETNDGVLSPTPAGGTNGLEAITGQDVDAMVKAMTGEGKPFTILPTTQVIGGVTFPAGIYSTNAFIMDAQITRAKIANLAVDNAKIADLSADKLTAGSIAVGQHIQSTSYVAGSQGWRINGNGTAEFGAASIRGLLTAAQIDTRGLTIKDANGNVILGAGTSLSTANISGLGTLATQNSVSTSQVSGLGTLATQNSVSTWQVSGLGLFATAPQLTNSNVSSYIANAAIGIAQIADTIQSTNWSSTAGWRINKAGTAFFNEVALRGSINSGAYIGYAWPAAGQSGFHLGPLGLLLGNGNDGRYLQVTSTGNIFTPGFNVVNGVMTVSQADVIGTLNIAGNAVTAPASAFTAAIFRNSAANSWQDAQSLTVSSTGSRITVFTGGKIVKGSASGGGDSGDGPLDPVFRLVRDSTVLMEGWPLTYSETPPAGTYTYKIQVFSPFYAQFQINGGLSYRLIFAIETKR